MENRQKGRPTKYKKKYDEQVYKLCLLGATMEEIADFFEVNPDTVYEWKNKHRNFSEAIRAGRTVADMEIAKSLYERAKGATYVQERAFKVKKVLYDEDGKRVMEEEELKTIPTVLQDPPDTKAAIHWLNVRQPDRWKVKDKDQEGDNKEEGFKAIAAAIMGKYEDTSE